MGADPLEQTAMQLPGSFQCFKAGFAANVAWWHVLDHFARDDFDPRWAFGMGVAAAWAALPAWFEGGLALLLVVRVHSIAVTFPHTVNHWFFEAWVLAALLVCSPARSLQLVRAAFVGVVFWAGVQKLAHGRYVAGEFYALSAADGAGFLGGNLRALVGLAERAVGAATSAPPSSGDPLRTVPLGLSGVAMLVLTTLSWATVLGELALPGLLAVRRTRTVGVVLALVMFAAIGLATRELSFVFTSILCTLLFAPGVSPPAPLSIEPRRDRLLLAPLLVWPPLHLVSSLALGFSPWRLAGWGMYATPHESARTVLVAPLPGDCAAIANLPSEALDPNAVRRMQAFPSTAGAVALAAATPTTPTLVWLVEPRANGWEGTRYGVVRAWRVQEGAGTVEPSFVTDARTTVERLRTACLRR